MPVLPGRSDAVAVTVTPGLADASTVVVYFHDPLAASSTAAPASTGFCALSTMATITPFTAKSSGAAMRIASPTCLLYCDGSMAVTSGDFIQSAMATALSEECNSLALAAYAACNYGLAKAFFALPPSRTTDQNIKPMAELYL